MARTVASLLDTTGPRAIFTCNTEQSESSLFLIEQFTSKETWGLFYSAIVA